MREEFDPSYTSETTSVLDVALQPDRVTEILETQRHRLRTAVGAFVLAAVSSLGIGANVIPAEAGTIATESSLPSTDYTTMTFSQKADAIEAAGHRGLKGWYNGGYAEEDSIRSCLHAFAAGADACEMDGQFTGDAVPVPVVNHDATTNRTSSNCNLVIANHTWNRERKCRLNGGDRFPSLARMARALAPYAGTKEIVYEFKPRRVPLSVVRRVNAIFAQNGFGPQNLTYESFYQRNLAKAKEVAPDVPRYLINGSTTNPPKAYNLNRSVVDGVIIPYAGMVNGLQADPNFVNEYRDRNMGVMPWNVETTSQMRFVINNNATGLISDHVGDIRNLRSVS